jgi:hypothetical protein
MRKYGNELKRMTKARKASICFAREPIGPDSTTHDIQHKSTWTHEGSGWKSKLEADVNRNKHAKED